MVANGCQLFQLGDKSAVFVKQLFGLVALEPFFQQLKVIGLLHGDGHLMCAEAVFYLLAVYDLRTCPALRRTEDDHRPHRSFLNAVLARSFLYSLDLFDNGIESFSHQLVHGLGVIALYEIRLPAAALKEFPDLVMRNSREDGGVGDLVAVEVEYGQNSTVGGGVQEFVRVPCGSERACFSLAVAYYAGGYHSGVIENRAESVRQRITELAALIDRAGSFRRNVRRYSARERELLEKLLHTLCIAGDVWVNFGVRAFKVGVGHHEVSSVAGAGDVDHIKIILLDNSVEVNVDKVLSGNSTPVTYYLFLDVVSGEGFAEQGVIQQVKLTCGKVVCSAPVGVHFLQKFRRNIASI